MNDLLRDKALEALTRAGDRMRADRDALADAHFDHNTGRCDEDGQVGVDEYDAILCCIESAATSLRAAAPVVQQGVSDEQIDNVWFKHANHGLMNFGHFKEAARSILSLAQAAPAGVPLSDAPQAQQGAGLAATEPVELTRSIIHDCPAIRLPQTWLQKLGNTARIVALKGASQEIAEALVARINSYPAPSGAEAMQDATAELEEMRQHGDATDVQAALIRLEATRLVAPAGASPLDLRKALRRAFNLGQTYWQQADSEYTSQHRKADATLATFNALVDETVAAHGIGSPGATNGGA